MFAIQELVTEAKQELDMLCVDKNVFDVLGIKIVDIHSYKYREIYKQHVLSKDTN